MHPHSLCMTLILVAGVANAQPAVWFPVNDAWQGATGAVQGAVFRLGAHGLGVPRVSYSVNGFPFPTVLGGFSVHFGETQAILLSAEPSNESPRAPADFWIIRGVLPSNAPAGASGPVSVSYNGRRIAATSLNVSVARRGFGLYRSGPFQATASNVDGEGKWTTNTYVNPARPGQSIVLWGTGLGAVVGDEAAGPLPQALDTAGLQLLVGNRPTPILYGGRVPQATLCGSGPSLSKLCHREGVNESANSTLLPQAGSLPKVDGFGRPAMMNGKTTQSAVLAPVACYYQPNPGILSGADDSYSNLLPERTIPCLTVVSRKNVFSC